MSCISLSILYLLKFVFIYFIFTGYTPFIVIKYWLYSMCLLYILVVYLFCFILIYFLIYFIFSSSFRFTGKLSRKYRDFPIYSLTDPTHIHSLPYQSGNFFFKDLFKYLFYLFLAASGLSCSTQDLR